MYKSLRILAGKAACLLAVSGAIPASAQAVNGPAVDAYRNECAACHIAYPAKMMSATAWKNILAHLDAHFGVNATLDASIQQDVTDYLLKNAGRSLWADEVPAHNRITQTRWFLRKHGEIPAEVWVRDAVRSAANCGACHEEADQAYFDDDSVRIPR